MKESFLLFASNEDNFKMLSNAERGKLIMAIFAFVKGKDTSATLSPLAKMAYISITQQIKIFNEKYDKRCETSRENGRLGGAPKGNQNAKRENVDNSVDNSGVVEANISKSPHQQENNLKQPNQPNRLFGNNVEHNRTNGEKQPKQPKNNLNNPYDYDYDNDYDIVSQRKNIFNNYNACAGARACERTEEERSPFKVFYKDLYDYSFTPKFINPANELADTMIEALEQAKTPQMLRFGKKQYTAKQLVDIYCKVDSELLRRIVSQLVFRDEEVSNRGAYILSCIIKSAEEHTIVHESQDIVEFKRALGVDL